MVWLEPFCSLHNQSATVDFLVETGVDLLSCGRYENMPSPLHIAIREGHLEVLNTLLQHELDPDIVGDDRRTPLIHAIPLHMAAQVGNFWAVKGILDQKVLGLLNKDGGTCTCATPQGDSYCKMMRRIFEDL